MSGTGNVPGIEHAASSAVWLRHTLDEILSQVRVLLDVDGCAFQTVDSEHGHISPAAAWFETPQVRAAMQPVLDRPYDVARGGVTEAAIERGEPLLISDIETWEGAAALRARLAEQLDEAAAETAWAWYRTSTFISCPVQTALGRTLGVLAMSAAPPLPPLGAEQLRVTEVFAGLAALALERTELFERQAQRAAAEERLHRAAQLITASLDLDAVYAAIVDQAALLAHAPAALLLRLDGVTQTLRFGADRGPPLRGRRGHDRHGRLRRRAVRQPRRGSRAVPAVGRRRGRALVRARPARARTAALRRADRHPSRRGRARRRLPGGARIARRPRCGGDRQRPGISARAAHRQRRDADGPAEVLAQANAILRRRLPGGVAMVTAFLGVIDGGVLRYANAGHVPPLVAAGGGADLRELPRTGLPLGVEEDVVYEARELPFGPGALLFASTDGLVEARRGGELFGQARVSSLVAANAERLGPQALVELAHAEAEVFADTLTDDIAIIALRPA